MALETLVIDAEDVVTADQALDAARAERNVRGASCEGGSKRQHVCSIAQNRIAIKILMRMMARSWYLVRFRGVWED